MATAAVKAVFSLTGTSKAQGLSGISYIFIHASLKEPAFLQDKGKATPEILQRVFPDILSIQSDPTGIHIVKPEKQADNGSLS